MTNSTYAWIIDRDHLYTETPRCFSNEAGVIGPRGANGASKADLANNYGRHHQFRMYDDDRELYYTGTLYFNGDPDEDTLYGPLADFGLPNAGCVNIKYTGKPEWECG